MGAPGLVIRGGLVFGGGAADQLVPADVAVENGRIAAIGAGLRCAGAEVLDATGLVVSPGFIDLHSHSDLTLFDAPGAESKILDGVTTELCGHCGFSPFPNEGAGGKPLGDPGRVFVDAASFFNAMEQAGMANNRACLAGHGTIRARVMGLDDRRPARGELERMRALLAEAMEQGAAGLSSGLEYAPGCFADVEELAFLAEEVGLRHGLYATHIRDEGDRLIESVEEALDVARRSKCRLQIGHLKTLGKANWGKIGELERVLRAALAQGVDVAADRYPYLACSTGLRALFSPWLMDGGPEKACERLRDAAARERLRRELGEEPGGGPAWDAVIVASTRSEAGRKWMGRSMAAVAQARGQAPVEAAMDLLAEEETRVGVVIFAMCEENLARIVNWPFVMVASDASARSLDPARENGLPHPRAFGTFARAVGRLAREKRVLTLEQALRKVTGQPAERMRLRERGLLRVGWAADVTVFDPEAILDTATFEAPYQASLGIRHVLVNGVAAVRDGAVTGARAGRALRKGAELG